MNPNIALKIVIKSQGKREKKIRNTKKSQNNQNKINKWRNLVGYSPWGRKESDSTEQLHKKEMAIHSSILFWEISWTEEPGRLKSMGSKKSRT